MPAPTPLPYAVIGATGQQGGAVVDALLARRLPVRALTRDPGSPASRALTARGVDVVRGDQDDDESMTTALTGVEALFVMTTYDDDAGVEGEAARGRAIADAAVRAHVPRVVYSSVGGSDRSTGIPHFESKRLVEEHLAARIPSSFVRPTFFMENLTRALGERNDEFVLRLPMPGTVPLQMVAVQDIGRVAAALLVDPSIVDGGAIEIAGDELTGDAIAARIGAHLGLPARFEGLPLQVLDGDPDRQAMFRWFVDTPAYQADVEATRAIDPSVLDLTSWLAEQGAA